jgi:Ca2+-binding RTX toxin-like protein
LGATATIVAGEVTYTAASGEENDVTVVATGGLFRITDPGAVITAGAGCEPVGRHEVTCRPGEKNVLVSVGDEADSVAVGPWPTMFVRVYGQGGNDLVSGGGGMSGGTGDDILRGGRFENRLEGGAGNDTLYGGPSFDVLDGGPGADNIQGGANIDILHGLLGADRLDGGAGGDWIVAGPGNDRLNGGGGNDHLLGGFGNDTIFGGAAPDELLGGPGNDVLYARDGLRDMLFGSLGFDRARTDIGLDVMHGVEQKF